MSILALLLPITISATTDWYVVPPSLQCVTGVGTRLDPFCSIEAALSAASDGDVIFLAPGDYFEDLDVNVDVRIEALIPGLSHLRGLSSMDVPLLNVPTGSSVEVDGLTISEGSAFLPGSVAGLNIDGSMTLRNSTVSGMRAFAFYGGPASNRVSGDLRVYDSLFEDNEGSRRGGALLVTNTGYVLAENSTFQFNSTFTDGGSAGGAIFVDWSAGGLASTQLVMRNCLVLRNRASGSYGSFTFGGGIGGSGYVSEPRPVRIENTTFSGNETNAGRDGAAISFSGFSSAAAVELSGCSR